jgi:hypothetical protein
MFIKYIFPQLSSTSQRWSMLDEDKSSSPHTNIDAAPEITPGTNKHWLVACGVGVGVTVSCGS